MCEAWPQIHRACLARLNEVESDERIHDYPAANFFSNSILAAEQMQLKAQADTLRWVLGLPPQKYPIVKQGATQ